MLNTLIIVLRGTGNKVEEVMITRFESGRAAHMFIKSQEYDYENGKWCRCEFVEDWRWIKMQRNSPGDFKDILFLDDRAIQKIMREIDSQELAKALKGTIPEIQEKIFRNMSKRAAEILKEDMEYMGPIRLDDCKESQERIGKIIHRLEEEGDIIIARNGDEMVV